MRVIAGKYKRILLKSPANDKIRPTSDKIKETLFNMIEPMLYDCCFVDLYAGTGQIGIEALSRGAKEAVFIDIDKVALALINANVNAIKNPENAYVIRGQLPGSVKKLEEFSPDIIFLDPPYKKGLYQEILSSIAELSSINDNTLIIAESDKNEDFGFLNKIGLYTEKEKVYKSNKHLFIRKGKNETGNLSGKF